MCGLTSRGPQPSLVPSRVPSLGGSTARDPSAALSPSRAGACTACTGRCPSCSPGVMTTPGLSAPALPSGCRHEGSRMVRRPRQCAVLLPRAGSSSELSLGARSVGTTRKHVRNDAGTRKSESVVCESMGQPVGDIGMHQSRRLLSAPGVLRHGCRNCVLPLTWPGHPRRSHA
jgi:hypothetical protein